MSIVGGTLLAPLLLPVLPFRSFALKGAVLGLLVSAAAVVAIPSLRDGVLIQALTAVTVTTNTSMIASAVIP